MSRAGRGPGRGARAEGCAAGHGRLPAPEALPGAAGPARCYWNTVYMAGLGMLIPDYISAEKITHFKNSANPKSTLGDN